MKRRLSSGDKKLCMILKRYEVALLIIYGDLVVGEGDINGNGINSHILLFTFLKGENYACVREKVKVRVATQNIY